VIGYVLFGTGTGTWIPGVANVAMRDVPPGLSGTASGVFNASRQVGTSIGLAILGAIGAAAATSAWTNQAAHLTGAARRAAIGQARNVASARISSVTSALGTGRRLAAEQAFTHGFQVAVFIAGLGLIAAAIIAAFGLRGNRSRELVAAAGKPAPHGDPDNAVIVARPHHTFVTRP
jgi:DHA2 family methylenomycin A resistance protein-like MFS transporter